MRNLFERIKRQRLQANIRYMHSQYGTASYAINKTGEYENHTIKEIYDDCVIIQEEGKEKEGYAKIAIPFSAILAIHYWPEKEEKKEEKSKKKQEKKRIQKHNEDISIFTELDPEKIETQ